MQHADQALLLVKLRLTCEFTPVGEAYVGGTQVRLKVLWVLELRSYALAKRDWCFRVV